MKLGWRNTTTWADEIDLTETWKLYYKLDGALMVHGLGFTRTATAPPLTQEDRQARMEQIERDVRAAGGIF
jgi:hypothetical protein